MSSDPVPSETVARALGEHSTPPAEHDPVPGAGPGSGSGEAPLLYAKVIGLCRLVGEERFFGAAFSQVRAERAGAPARRPHAYGGLDAWVLELDVDEVLRDALGGDAPGPGGG